MRGGGKKVAGSGVPSGAPVVGRAVVNRCISMYYGIHYETAIFGVPIANRRADTSLPRANPEKSGDAEPRDYRDDDVAMSAEPPAMLLEVARMRARARREIRGFSRRGTGCCSSYRRPTSASWRRSSRRACGRRRARSARREPRSSRQPRRVAVGATQGETKARDDARWTTYRVTMRGAVQRSRRSRRGRRLIRSCATCRAPGPRAW